MWRAFMSGLFLVLIVATCAVARADDDVEDATDSEVLEEHERTLQELLRESTHAAPSVKDAFRKLAEQASSAPSLQELRERESGSSERESPRRVEREIEQAQGEVARDEWIVAREALFTLSALRQIGILDVDAVPESRDEDWHREALERASLMGDDWARTAFGYRLWKGFDGVEKDEERALQMLREVAAIGLERGPTTYEIEGLNGAEWLRDRDRDASWFSESVAAKAADQVALELDAAARGDDSAHAQLGYRALVGDRGVEQDEGAAFQHFYEAAQRRGGGLPEAHYNLGFMYMNGMGTNKNYTAAKEQFTKAISKGGIAPAYNGLGVLEYNGLLGEKNYTAAMAYFEEAAKREDPDGYFNLAQMYILGHDVEANATYGVEIMEKAAELGHWRAPYELGLAHASGEAVERNVSRATRLFHVFIEERFSWDKQRNDAIEDVLVHQNSWGALIRYSLVSSLGSESAANNVVWLLRKSNAYTNDDRFELAARMLREIIHCYGSPEARVDLADLLRTRKVEPDLTFDLNNEYEQAALNASTYDRAAVQHYVAAAFSEKPYAEALVNLGWAHLLGSGVVVNFTRSLELFAAGAAASHNSYEAAPCVIAGMISKLWLLAASASLRMNFGSLGLPDSHFSSLKARSLAGSSNALTALQIIQGIEIIERYSLYVLTLALASVLAYRMMLPSR